MDYKKTNAAPTTISRDIIPLMEETGNLYESVVIMSKRANQIGAEIKHINIIVVNIKRVLLVKML